METNTLGNGCYRTPVNVFGGDALKLPLRSDSFDAAICIAVMHHLSTVERRLALLRWGRSSSVAIISY